MLSESPEDEVILGPDEKETDSETEISAIEEEEETQEPILTEVSEEDTDEAALNIQPPVPEKKIPVLLFFIYWSLSSLIAYSIAGEKMPWLTVHIAMPLAFSAAWGLGYLTEILSWKRLFSKDGMLGLVGLVLALFGICGLGKVFNSIPLPFSGKDLEQLRATFRLVTVLLFLAAGIMMVRHFWKKWHAAAIAEVCSLCVMVMLIVLQTRTAFVSSFINYDYTNELLTYAHGGPGSKVAWEIIEDLGRRTGLGKSIGVAYDNDVNYPFWWYLRDYTNKKYFGEDNPTRELRNYDIIAANTSKDSRLEPIVKDGYYRYEYIRLWWPNQDYFNLTPQRILNSLANPDMRHALFKIWLDRDYSEYMGEDVYHLVIVIFGKGVHKNASVYL